jgi:hypothetical protein
VNSQAEALGQIARGLRHQAAALLAADRAP